MDSDDYTTDEGSRKRSAEPIAEIFNKSKRTLRSPQKPQKEQEEKMDKILHILTNLTTEIKELKEEQKEYRKEIRDLRYENEKIKQENNELKLKAREIEERVDKLEKENRRRNIVIRGIEIKTQDENENKEMVENFLNKTLQLRMDIKGAKKLGEKVCMVQLKNETDKRTIMMNKAKLKGIKEPRVFIDDDMSKEEREIQVKIRNKAKEEKAAGKTVKIGFQKLIVGENTWIWNKNKGCFDILGNTRKTQKN